MYKSHSSGQKTLNSYFTCEAQHVSNTTDVGLEGYGLLPSSFFFFYCDPKREKKRGNEKDSVIWIHSLEEVYKILTVLPGAKLELDAVRINW